jgi:hypothetical protein
MPSVGFRLFADSSEFERGLSGAEGKVSHVGERMLGLRGATHALATALGVNLENIAQGLARLVTGFSKDEEESLKNLVEQSGKAAEAQEAALEKLKEKRIKLKEDTVKLDREVLDAQSTAAEKLNRLNAEARQIGYDIMAGRVAGIKYLEAAKRLDELKLARLKLHAEIEKENDTLIERKLKLVEREEKLRRDGLPIAQQIKATQADIANLLDEQKAYAPDSKGYLDIAEAIATARDHLRELTKEQKEFTKERTAAQAGVARAGANLAEAQEDRGKMTLQELASVSKFSPGVSMEAAGQKDKAQEVLDLQQKAETARKGGDASGAIEMFSRADEMKSGLTALKSGERADPMAAMKNALKESEDQLKAINAKFAGTAP